MSFIHQYYNTNGWTLRLDWDAEPFGIGRSVEFILAFTHDAFVVPRFLSRSFWVMFTQQESARQNENRPAYTMEEALLDVPVINMRMGEFHTQLQPEEYLMEGPETVFGHSLSRDPVLPSWLVKRWVLQLESTEQRRRIGVCLPH
jgi:hypothetical protein